VQGLVELAVPGAVEPHPYRPAAGGRDRRRATEHGEGGVSWAAAAQWFVTAVADPWTVRGGIASATMAAYGHRPVRRHPSHDYAAALTWYERLLGSPPAFFPNDIEAVWELAEHRYLFIEQRPEHAGHAMQTFFVDDFDALIAQITDRGVEPTERETYSNGVRKTTYCDPDGNEVGFGGPPSARNQPRPGEGGRGGPPPCRPAPSPPRSASRCCRRPPDTTDDDTRPYP
jgi:predicted enzyme related to lactoylglutathione lyase